MGKHTQGEGILVKSKVPYKLVVDGNIIATINLNGEMTEETYRANAERIVRCWNEYDNLLNALDMVTRVFIYSTKQEFNAKDKIKATELAVKTLCENGITNIGQTFEKTTP